MRRTKSLLILILILVLATAFSGCSKKTLKPVAADKRNPAAAFSSKDLFTGDDVEFKAASAGRVRMLNFFSPG